MACVSFSSRPNAFPSKFFQPSCRVGLIFRAILALAAVSCMLFVSAAAGQTAHFTSVESVVPTSTLNGPNGVAIDGNGNIYIADTNNNRILKETRTQNGYEESTIGSGWILPEGIAVDANGNIYVTNRTGTESNGTVIGAVVKETLSNGSYTPTVLASGDIYPLGIAVDSAGNVYFVNEYANEVVKETPSGGGYTESAITCCGIGGMVGVAVDGSGNVYITAVSSNEVVKETLSGGSYTGNVIAYVNRPVGIAVDMAGDVYISEANSNMLLKETPSGGGYTQSTYSSIPDASELAVDENGSIYIPDYNGDRVLKEMLSGANFGTVDVRTLSSPMTMVFTFGTDGSIGKPAVVTQGAAGLDFADAGTGTCNTNGTSYVYSAGDTCTVDVTFTPKLPGARYGAALLKDAAGNVIATGYAQGIGVGPQVNFPPGTQSTLPLGTLEGPAGITVDAQGNLYIVQAVSQNSPENVVIKETRSGSSYTKSIVASGLGLPASVAVDGSGSVYIADEDNFEVWKATPSLTGYTQSVAFSNLGNVTGIAVDGSSDIYIVSDVEGVLKETPNGSGGYVQSTIAGTGPYGVAVDNSGDVYTADFVQGRILKYTLSNGSYAQSVVATGLGNPTGIAVDGLGNIYIANELQAGQIIKETLSNGAYTKSIVSSGLNLPTGIAVDGTGNLYISSHVNGSSVGGLVEAVDLVDPPSLSFAATAFGLTSSGSPLVVTVRNAGNAPLNFPALSSGSNPNVSTNFVIDSNGSGACPVIDPEASTPGSVSAAASCALSISFAPMETGALSGSVVLTDNNLNATAPGYATQTILLSGIGTQAIPAISLTSSDGFLFLSNAVTFTATVTANGGPPSGTASFYDGSTLLEQVNLASGSASYTTSSLAVGTHSITAVYSGDTNFLSETSSAVNTDVQDFSIASSGSGTVTTAAGGQATFPLTITPVGGATMPAPIALTVSGLPAGATASFSPDSISAGSGTTDVTLKVSTSSQTSATKPQDLFRKGRVTLVFAVMLLPFWESIRRASRRLNRAGPFMLIFLAVALSLAGLAGCGSKGGSGNGTSTPPSHTYTLTVTGSSGSLSHSTTITLTVG